MYTRKDAQNTKEGIFDKKIKQAVEEADNNTAWLPIYWDGSSPYTATELVEALIERGFENIELRDPDSMRFAEVHFSW